MKKTIILILCVCLIVAMAVSAGATGSVTMTVTPSETTLKQGQSVVITVSVSEFAGCTGGALEIVYDESSFSRSNNTWMLPGSPTMQVPDGKAVFAYGSSAAATVSGNIYQFTLTAKETSHLGAMDIGVTLQLNAGDVAVKANQKLSITISCSHSYGTWNRLNDTQHGQTCTKCGNVVKEDHTWDAGKTEIKADCSKAGLIIYTCTKCSATKEVTTDRLSHTYDNDCDKDCNVCSQTRTVTHKYSDKWSSDGTSHWHQCSVCGDKADTAAHTPGAAATEWSAQTCTVCSHVLQSALGHTHKYSSEWTFDEMGHWYECSGCEELKSYADHTYDNACDTDCNACGYKREIQHTYSVHWWFDATGHWQECSVCGEKTELAAHIPGPEATAESAQTCVDCGYELAPMLGHTHDYGYDWYSDETGHWQVCGCGTASAREPHTWDDGTVTKQPTADEEGETLYICTTCDAEKKESIPKQEGTQPEDPTEPTSGKEPNFQDKEFPWWILIVAGGVLALGFIIFMIVGAIIGQKQTGRFSEK